MRFAVIGGDMRIARLCQMLMQDGHEVYTYALEEADAPLLHKKTLLEAVWRADCVVLPLPITTGDGMLNTSLSQMELSLSSVINELPAGTLACGGLIGSDVMEMAEKRGIILLDYLQREELAVSNAVAAAEGAIGLIMEEMPITVWNCRILVLGYGRLGKILAYRLRGMGAIVSVSARSWGDMTWIKAYGYEALNTNRLDGKLGRFDVVVNTVPYPVLGERLLKELKEDVFCLDLASNPGGLDFPAAAGLGIRAMWALSLPGQVAPLTSGAIIRDTIYNIITERRDGA